MGVGVRAEGGSCKAEAIGGQVMARKKHHLEVSPVAGWAASIGAEDAADQPLLRYGSCRDACGHRDAVSAGAASETKELFLVCGRQGCGC